MNEFNNMKIEFKNLKISRIMNQQAFEGFFTKVVFLHKDNFFHRDNPLSFFGQKSSILETHSRPNPGGNVFGDNL